jgi:hypothetical protein
MNNLHKFESQLWRVLESDRLSDLSQFHKSNFHDEVPLYSRFNQIDFLADFPRQQLDEILIAFSIRFLRAIVSYQEHRTPYFAAITIWNFLGDESVVPNVFFWSGHMKALQSCLSLKPVGTSWGKSIQSAVADEDFSRKLIVLEDDKTMPGSSRLFVSYRKPPYKTFVPLSRFRNKARSY